MDWTFVIMESVREMLTRVGIFIPKLIGLLLILIVGWLLAKFIEAFIVRSLKLIRLDTLAEKSGTSNFLAKGGIKYTLSELIGVLVYWLVVLMVFITALNANFAAKLDGGGTAGVLSLDISAAETTTIRTDG